MTEPPNGLRFDIYERVHLPDDVAAIDELEEIELVPHMRVQPQEDSVLLSGHLLLSGVYRAQHSGEASQLTHWIPVEITLPLNRVQNVDEVGVEIDNFDVDLLSTRSLNVTGVLALRGLEVSSAQEPIWKDDSFTVVHQAQPSYEPNSERGGLSGGQPQESYADYEEEAQASAAQLPSAEPAFEPERIESPQSYAPQPPQQPQQQQPQQPQQPQSQPSLAGAPDDDNWIAKFQSFEEQRKLQPQARSAQSSALPAIGSAEGWGDLSEKREDAPIASAEPLPDENQIPAEPALLPDAPPALEAIEPVKIAINGAATEPAIRIQSGVGLLSQLGDIGARRESDLKQQEVDRADEKAQAKAASVSTGDELEWTRLLSGADNEAQSFRKVRMCIVQRDDTLEAIADKYNVQPRVLQMHNKLNDPYLSEGQVLYIP